MSNVSFEHDASSEIYFCITSNFSLLIIVFKISSKIRCRSCDCVLQSLLVCGKKHSLRDA